MRLICAKNGPILCYMTHPLDARAQVLTRLFGGPPRFDPEDDTLDLEFVDRLAPLVETLSRYFRPTYNGLENIPREGAALLVGNHGLTIYDGFFLALAIYRETGRLIRGLGERLLFTVPGIRDFWLKIGAVEGTKENALKFLRAGHLVNTYPGGSRDALKDRDGLYRLHWDRSFGFVQVALRAQVPVIIHVGIGTDETYRHLGRWRWPGRVLGSSSYEIPLLWGWGPLPRPVKFTFYVSEPIPLQGTPEDADDPVVVERIHRALWDRGHEMIAAGLRRRRSLWFG